MPIALTYLDVDGGYDYDLDTLDDVQAGPTTEPIRHYDVHPTFSRITTHPHHSRSITNSRLYWGDCY